MYNFYVGVFSDIFILYVINFVYDGYFKLLYCCKFLL